MSHVTAGKKSNTNENLKDCWRTSDLAYNDACYLCGVGEFDIDLAAKSHIESLAECFYTEDNDSLANKDWFWGDIRRGWLNPPFSKKVEFLQRAYNERKNGLICVMIPYEPCTKWFRESVHNKASVVFVPDGRYNFLHPETGEEIKGVNFACCFAVFNGLEMPTGYVNFERGVGSRS